MGTTERPKALLVVVKPFRFREIAYQPGDVLMESFEVAINLHKAGLALHPEGLDMLQKYWETEENRDTIARQRQASLQNLEYQVKAKELEIKERQLELVLRTHWLDRLFENIRKHWLLSLLLLLLLFGWQVLTQMSDYKFGQLWHALRQCF